MHARVSTPTLTHTALLAAVGLTLILMPFGAGRAQAPARPEANPFGATAGAAPAAQDPAVAQDVADKLRWLQAQKDRVDAEMKKLEKSIRDLQAHSTTPAPGANSANPGATAQKPSAAAQYGYRAALKPSGSVEQRLEHVERKLDTLLWEVTNLRRDLVKPGRANVPATTPPAPWSSAAGVRPAPTAANPYIRPVSPTPPVPVAPAHPPQPVDPPSAPAADPQRRTFTPPPDAPVAPAAPAAPRAPANPTP